MKRAFQYVTHYGSANQEFADASVRRYEQKGVLRAGVPSPSPQSPSPFSLPPYPLPPTPFDACYAGYSQRILGRLKVKKDPISPEMLKEFVESKIKVKSPSLSDLRSVALCLICYDGFFCFSE